jgi:hypothetical protein
MSLRTIIIFLFISLGFTNGFGQRWKLTRYEVLGGLGAANIFGDIGGSTTKNNLLGLKDIRLKETGLSTCLGVRYFLKEDQAIRLNLIFAFSQGNDIGSYHQSDRTIPHSYSVTFFEPSVQYEYYFIKSQSGIRVSTIYNRPGMLNSFALMDAYAFLGAGGLFFSPKLTGLAGAGETISGYSKMSGVIALGAGVKLPLNKDMTLGFEIGRRFTFTDYLDGLSTIYSKSNDTYYFTAFHLIIRLETDRRGIPVIFTRRKFYE